MTTAVVYKRENGASVLDFQSLCPSLTPDRSLSSFSLFWAVVQQDKNNQQGQ